MSLTTLKSILAAVFAVLGSFDVPSAPPVVRCAMIGGASFVIGIYIWKAHPATSAGNTLDSILQAAMHKGTPVGGTTSQRVPGT